MGVSVPAATGPDCGTLATEESEGLIVGLSGVDTGVTIPAVIGPDAVMLAAGDDEIAGNLTLASSLGRKRKNSTPMNAANAAAANNNMMVKQSQIPPFLCTDGNCAGFAGIPI